jgi:hypothetical protein
LKLVKIEFQTFVLDNDGFHLMTMKNNTEENLLQIFRLLSNYQTVKDELKVKTIEYFCL